MTDMEIVNALRAEAQLADGVAEHHEGNFKVEAIRVSEQRIAEQHRSRSALLRLAADRISGAP